VRSALQSPRLRRILAAYTINRLGTWFGYVALSVAVFDHTHSALAVAVLLVAAQVLPAIIGPAIVAKVESSSRRGLLSGLYLVETLATVALAILLSHFWLPALLLLVLIDGTAALAASSLLRAQAAKAGREHFAQTEAGRENPERTEEAERRANAALNIAFSGTFVLGPAIAGALVASAGAPAALYIDAATFVICGGMLLDLRPHVEALEGGSVRARLTAAWQHIRSVPALRALLVAEAAALVFFQFSAPIEVVYAKVTLHAGARGYGLLLGTWGVGVVAGSLVFARTVNRSLKLLLSTGTLAVGLAYVGFAAAPTLIVACLAALLGGLGNGVQWASLISAVQSLTPPSLQGRLMGAVESLSWSCPALGLLLGGGLVAVSSPRVAFLVAGLGAVATTVAFLRLSLQQTGPSAVETPIVVADRAARTLRDATPGEPSSLG
jgi:MFS family permease